MQTEVQTLDPQQIDAVSGGGIFDWYHIILDLIIDDHCATDPS